MRDFEGWLGNFVESIATYGYYVDWDKIFSKVETLKVELHILNSLVGSRNIKREFLDLVARYPEIKHVIPILIAKRDSAVPVLDIETGYQVFDFNSTSLSDEECAAFMEKSGLFHLISERIVDNLYDFVTGVETGLDSNARKNRGGHLMENLVRDYLLQAGLQCGSAQADQPTPGWFYKEIYASKLESWGLDMRPLTNQGKSGKRFDFAVCTNQTIFGIETNFYSSGGSKLNETARSYKQLAEESRQIPGFEFVWFTDGKGWHSAKRNLLETFEVMEHIYSIADLESGICTKLFDL